MSLPFKPVTDSPYTIPGRDPALPIRPLTVPVALRVGHVLPVPSNASPSGEFRHGRVHNCAGCFHFSLSRFCNLSNVSGHWTKTLLSTCRCEDARRVRHLRKQLLCKTEKPSRVTRTYIHCLRTPYQKTCSKCSRTATSFVATQSHFQRDNTRRDPRTECESAVHTLVRKPAK